MTRQDKTTLKRLRDYETNALRAIRRCFVEPERHEDCMACEIARNIKPLWVKLLHRSLIIGFISLIVIFCQVRCAHAEDIAGHDINKWADAIYTVEGGSKTKHPYGVLKQFKHTTPRQACINTIRHQHRNWVKTNKIKPFTLYLAEHYAPIHCSNDPHNLNINWQRNLVFYLKKGDNLNS